MLLTSVVIAPNNEAPKTLTGDPGQQTHTEQNLIKAFVYDTLSDPVSVFTLCLVGSTVLLWRATLKLAREGRESAVEQSQKLERSAAAMERVANSMAINAEKVVESVAMQRRFGEMHLRARLDVQIGMGLYQDERLLFEAQPRLLNTGNSTAQSIRWRITCEVHPVPLPDGFRFRLPKNVGGSGAIASGQDGYMAATVAARVPDDEAEKVMRGIGQSVYVWGYVSYDDGFGRTRRRTFAQQIWWVRTGETHADGSPKEIVRGIYVPKHNRGN